MSRDMDCGLMTTDKGATVRCAAGSGEAAFPDGSRVQSAHHRCTKHQEMPTSTGDVPLFVDDDELRRRINPKIGRERFRSAIRALEAKFPDFPRIHALWQGRYWPAVKQWLDHESGLGKHAQLSATQDGSENFDVPAER